MYVSVELIVSSSTTTKKIDNRLENNIPAQRLHFNTNATMQSNDDITPHGIHEKEKEKCIDTRN